jgi:hypothetical protein
VNRAGPETPRMARWFPAVFQSPAYFGRRASLVDRRMAVPADRRARGALDQVRRCGSDGTTMPFFGRKAKATPDQSAPTPPPRGPNDLEWVGNALVATFESAITDSDGRIRVEDLLSSAAAVCGEACIVAAGEFDPEEHAFSPGSAVLSDRMNGILLGDAQDWDRAGNSVFGIIWSGALARGYEAQDFPPIAEPIRQYVASLGSDAADPEASWGRVALSIPEDNRPRVQPLRQAFELRPAVRQVFADRAVLREEWPSACAVALAIELARVRQAIDPGIAVRIVLETVNGMAKMAPMTMGHMRDATSG